MQRQTIKLRTQAGTVIPQVSLDFVVHPLLVDRPTDTITPCSMIPLLFSFEIPTFSGNNSPKRTGQVL